jgi:carbamoyltransferase
MLYYHVPIFQVNKIDAHACREVRFMIHWGVSFGSHDSALAVLADNELVFASHGERFSRIKDDPDLCQDIVNHALERYGEPHRVTFHESMAKKRWRYLLSGQISNIMERSPKRILADLGIRLPMSSVDHHHSHAAAGYYTSGFDNAAVVVVDAIGEMAAVSIWEGSGPNLKRQYQQDYPHSLGLFYSAMAQAAGYKPNGEEYIFMGLAAYGDPERYSGMLMEKFIRLNCVEPLVEMEHNLHRGCGGMVDGLDAADLAAGTQRVYELCLRHILDHAWKESPSKNLVLMGGCALNCVANSLIGSWQPWQQIWIMPNPGDAGSALGAILADRRTHVKWPGPYLGYEIPGDYPSIGLIGSLESMGIAAVANGRAEFGPRALGNRSILADPRIPDIKDRMNWIKKRERFRPFAAVIPESLARRFFDLGYLRSSPYMQYVFRCMTPERYPGIVHVDGTSRIQTVNAEQHPGLHGLLMDWYARTGCPMLANTSLNIKGQPLVNDEQDATDFQQKYGIPVLMRENAS